MPESESREMYLKSIYELAAGEELVPVSLLASRMGISRSQQLRWSSGWKNTA